MASSNLISLMKTIYLPPRLRLKLEMWAPTLLEHNISRVLLWVLQVPSEKLQRAGKVLRNAILSRAPHMIRDRKYHLKTYRCVLQINPFGSKCFSMDRLSPVFKACDNMLQTMLRRDGAGGLVSDAECLCAHTLPCCWDVAGAARRRSA